MDTLQSQNKPESNAAVPQDAPTRMIQPALQQAAPPAAKRPFFTGETLYVWGFRFVCFAIVACFLFVTAIYYGIINP